ncbi:MAG: kinase [Candidatus Kuenenia sp.]|nr:kinase [Candidatus Kuenenia hertensis]
MIISRTPFRISFFGGGTDYPGWYKENEGAVLATTIDKYCYITCRYLPPFFDHKHRIVYSKIESVKDVSEIQHPSVKATLQFMNIEDGLEIHHDGDLPKMTGLGSSSSFTVGLLHALYALKGRMPTKSQLAHDAIKVEQDIIKEHVGSQDQVLASFGGFNKIIFNNTYTFQINPIIINSDKLLLLQKHLMFFFTGFSRYASDIAKSKIENIDKKRHELWIIRQMVEEALTILNNESRDITEFGKLLHESWKLKKSLSDKVSNSEIDGIYDAAQSAGAIGGKLIGAGGGGFMLLFARPEDQPRIKEKLKNLLLVPFKFENNGTQIIVYQPEDLGIVQNGNGDYEINKENTLQKIKKKIKNKEESYSAQTL